MAEICRLLDEDGTLAAAGVTRGECLNILRGPASANANNFIAGLCGLDGFPESVGASNKGQCIKIVRDLV